MREALLRILRLSAHAVDAAGRAAGRLLDVPAAVVFLVFFSASVYQWDGGYLGGEAYSYLRHYSSDRPLKAKLFDYRGTDVSWNYQARELSYLVDYLDYNVCASLIRRKVPFFLSTSSYLGALLLALLAGCWCRRCLGLDRPVSNALLLLLLTHPTFLLLGPVFRSAKMGATVCVTACL